MGRWIGAGNDPAQQADSSQASCTKPEHCVQPQTQQASPHLCAHVPLQPASSATLTPPRASKQSKPPYAPAVARRSKQQAPQRACQRAPLLLTRSEKYCASAMWCRTYRRSDSPPYIRNTIHTLSARKRRPSGSCQSLKSSALPTKGGGSGEGGGKSAGKNLQMNTPVPHLLSTPLPSLVNKASPLCLPSFTAHLCPARRQASGSVRPLGAGCRPPTARSSQRAGESSSVSSSGAGVGVGRPATQGSHNVHQPVWHVQKVHQPVRHVQKVQQPVWHVQKVQPPAPARGRCRRGGRGSARQKIATAAAVVSRVVLQARRAAEGAVQAAAAAAVTCLGSVGGCSCQAAEGAALEPAAVKRLKGQRWRLQLSSG
eukprot:365418-Chlamydomonas_euryale.AAC.2